MANAPAGSGGSRLHQQEPARLAAPAAPQSETAVDVPLARAPVDHLIHQIDGAARVQLLRSLQRSAGNGALQSIVARSPSPVIQRDNDTEKEKAAGLLEAIQLVNKNSAIKIKLGVKPRGPVEGGLAEIKKVEVELDGTIELSSPQLLSAHPDLKIGINPQNTYKGESDPKKGRSGDWAGVYAAEAKGKLDPVLPPALQQGVEWKLTAGEYTPGREYNSKLGISLDNSVISAEANFNLLKVDLTKQGSERFKPATFTIKLGTGKFLEYEKKNVLTVGGFQLNAKGRLKVSGIVEIGPNWERLGYEIAKTYGKEAGTEFFKKNLREIAKEQGTRAVDDVAKELAKEACKDIAQDDPLRPFALETAEKRAKAEAERQAIAASATEAAEKIGMQEVTDQAAARLAMRQAAQRGARDTMRSYSQWLPKYVWDEVKKLGKDMVPDFLKKRLGAKAAEREAAAKEAELVISEEAKKLGEQATKDIAEKGAKKEAQSAAEAQAVRELEAAGVKTEAIVAAEHAAAATAEKAAARAAMREAILEVVTGALRKMGPELLKKIGTGLAEFSIKRAATRVAAELAGGPADFVLIGVEIIAHWIDTVIKDQEAKVAGLQAVRMQDNYVAGYTAGLMGTAQGAGQVGGAGNMEGTANLLGVKEGTDNLNKILDDGAKDYGADRAKLLDELKKSPVTVTRDPIAAKASGIIQQLLQKAWVKRHKGWFDSEEEVMAGKDFKAFRDVVSSNLANSGRGTTARLANGITLQLTALDSTSDRAQQFRTADGKYVVSMGGDTTKHSGWITSGGVPLEEIYTGQGDADKASSDDAGREASMGTKLKQSTVRLNVQVMVGEPKIRNAYLTTPGDKDPVFVDYMLSPAAQGQSLKSAGCKVILDGPVPAGTYGGGSYKLTSEGAGDVSVWVAPPLDLKSNVPARNAVAAAEIDVNAPDAVDQYFHRIFTDFANRTFASLPSLVG